MIKYENKTSSLAECMDSRIFSAAVCAAEFISEVKKNRYYLSRSAQNRRYIEQQSKLRPSKYQSK
jgi:hypothetical protein